MVSAADPWTILYVICIALGALVITMGVFYAASPSAAEMQRISAVSTFARNIVAVRSSITMDPDDSYV